MATVIPDISPSDLLEHFRGQILSARPGYPEVIHLKVRDADGGEWGFSTFYAEYSPEDPDFFPGKTVSSADLEPSGKLTIGFSDGSEFNVVPIPLEADEPGNDLETWHLFTPDGLALFYGPRGRWELGQGSDPC
jgi:hypothetical protein